jgi:arylsulfatase A-like enzyme
MLSLSKHGAGFFSSLLAIRVARGFLARMLPLVVAGWLAACADGDDVVLQPVHRLVDHVTGAKRLSDLPTQSIADETRYVLRTYPTVRIDPVSGRDVFPIRQALPDDVRDATRVVVAGRYGWDRKSRDVAPRVVQIERRAGALLETDVTIPEPPGDTVTMVLRGTVPPDGPVVRTETGVLAVPEGAVLEFGIGIDPLAWEQPAVTFDVQVCESERCTSVFHEALDPARADGRTWQDRRVPLDRWAGREARLRFDAHVVADDVDAYGLPYWSNPTVYTATARAPDAWNLILVSADTLGARHLSSHGYPRATAPFLDGPLAQRGTTFGNCFSADSTTAPSHMTAFTSLQPSVHGITGNLIFKTITPATRTLAGVLREAGFETGAITDDGPLAAMHGFARGFNSYSERKGAAGDGNLGAVDATFDDGRRWLRRHAGARFFLFLHTFQVHTPYAPPEVYAEYFPDPLPGEERLPPAFRPTLYDREIRYLDDELRAFFEDLDDMGLWSNTLLVFMGDHGEAFLEHDFLFHGGVMHDEVLRVPLTVVGPGVAAGRRVEEPVGLLDLAPTLLEWLGVRSPPGIMGRSFAASLRGTGGTGASSDRPIYSETWTELTTRMTADGIKTERLEHPVFAVRKHGRKLIRRGPPATPQYQYYDVGRDPEERDDLYDGDPAAAADLRALLEAYEASMARTREALAAGEDMPALPPELVDPAHLERLRALGYIQ